MTTTDKITTGEPYFVEKEQHEPSIFETELKTEIIEIVSKALDALNIEYGASHTELIITPEKKIFIVEVGARMGGDNIGAKLVQLSTGFDFVKGVIQVALGEKPIIRKTIKKYSGIFYITPPEGKIESIIENKKKSELIVDVYSILKVGDNTIYPVKESSHRAGFIQYQSDNRPNFEEFKNALVYKIIK